LIVFRQGASYADADGGLCTTGSLIGTQDRVLQHVRLDGPGETLLTGNFSGAVNNIYLEPGDEVRLLLFFRRRIPKADNTDPSLYRGNISVTLSSAELACTAFDGPTLLNPAAVLPESVRQKDLLKDFMLRTNTVPLVDQERRTVHFLSRKEFTNVQGDVLNLSDYVDPATYVFQPALGQVATVVFRPAEGLAASKADVVRFPVADRTGPEEKTITGSFAAPRFRSYRLLVEGGISSVLVELPSQTTEEEEKETPRSESQQTASGKPPLVVRYLGPDPDERMQVIVGTRRVPIGRSDYGGPLAWAGDDGAVSRYYRDFLATATRGHLTKCTVALTPARYAACRPGRLVSIQHTLYTIEAVESYDPSQPLCLTTLTLLALV
jgi:hypothetical protein